MKIKQIVISLVIFIFLVVAFYFVDTRFPPVDSIFLTVSTFLFAIFAGFFTSRQSTRHEDLRERIAQFDGNLTSIFRASESLDVELQNDMSLIIKDHYNKILDTKRWDYHFNHKSETIKNIHDAFRSRLTGKNFDDLGKAILAQVEWSLRDLQRVRKDQVSLYKERIPLPQWFLIYVLATILIGTITAIPSYQIIFSSILKAAFTVSVISVLYLLNRLDAVSFFEGTIGESSAKDAIGVVDGVK